MFYLTKVGHYVAWFVLGVVALVFIAALLRIPLPIFFLAGFVEAKAQAALGRRVEMGVVFVVPGIRPQARLSGLSIRNPAGWTDGQFALIDNVSAAIDLPALFERQILIGAVKASGVELGLEVRADGTNNWAFKPVTDGKRPPDTEDASTGKPFQFEGVEHISITGLSVDYRDRRRQLDHALDVAQIRGAAVKGAPIKLTLRGGEIANSTFQANLDLDMAPARPRLSGTIDVTRFDLAPITEVYAQKQPAEAKQSEMDPKTSGLPQLSRERLAIYELLEKLDTDVQIHLRQVVNAAVDIRDVSFHMDLTQAELQTPMLATVNGIPFRGKASLTQPGKQVKFAVHLSTENVDIGKLTEDLFEAEGTLKGISFEATSSGRSLRALVRKLDMRIAVSELDMTYGKERPTGPVRLTLGAFDFAIPSKGDVRVQADGSIKDEKFSVAFKGGTVKKLLNAEPWPVGLTVALAGADLRIDGAVTSPDLGPGSRLDVDVAGPDLGKLAKFTGLEVQEVMPYALSGTVSISEEGVNIQPLTGSLDEMQLTGSVVKKTKAQAPHYSLDLSLDAVDLDRLSKAFAGPEPETGPTAQQEPEPKIRLRMPILPKKIDLPDCDLSLSVSSLSTKGVRFEGIELSSRFRDGRFEKSPFQAAIGSTRFEGEFALDTSKPLPQLDFGLVSEQLDLGVLLKDLGVVEELPARADRVAVDLMLKGHRLRELLEGFELRAQVTGGAWVSESPGSNRMPVLIDKATLEVSPNRPVRFRQEMTVRGVPLKLEATMQEFAGISSREEQKFRAEIKSGQTQMTVNGAFKLPIRTKELDLQVGLHGKRVDELKQLLARNLPAWGPYEMEGSLRLQDKLVSLSDASLRLGDSHMTGSATLDWRQQRPLADVRLVARQVQLDDFPFQRKGEDAKANVNASRADPALRTDQSSIMEEIANKTEKASQLLEPTAPWDFDVELRVTELLSGTERLGDGIARLVRKEGVLEVRPIKINLPGGRLDAAFSVDKRQNGFVSHLTAGVEGFSYGTFFRILDPDSEANGRVSLIVDLTAPTRDPAKFFSAANGQVDFLIVPKKLSTGLLDFWSTGLLRAIFITIVSTSESVINCAIGRFDVKDGVMEHDTILIDTTKIRIKGKGKLDFRTGEIKLELDPDAKKPEFLSLETPIKVAGRIDDIHIGTGIDSLIGTYVRVVASPIIAPLKRIFTKEPPKDGSDVCTQSIHRAAGG